MESEKKKSLVIAALFQGDYAEQKALVQNSQEPECVLQPQLLDPACCTSVTAMAPASSNSPLTTISFRRAC